MSQKWFCWMLTYYFSIWGKIWSYYRCSHDIKRLVYQRETDACKTKNFHSYVIRVDLAQFLVYVLLALNMFFSVTTAVTEKRYCQDFVKYNQQFDYGATKKVHLLKGSGNLSLLPLLLCVSAENISNLFRSYLFTCHFLENIYLFKVNNRNTRKRRQICSKLTI